MGGFSTTGGARPGATAEEVWGYTTRTLTSISRAIFEVDEGNLLWTFLHGRAVSDLTRNYDMAVLFPTRYADKAIRSFAQENAGLRSYVNAGLLGRYSNRANYYLTGIYSGATTADLELKKIVNNTVTALGSEAVDLLDINLVLLKLSCVGSRISAYREDMTTPKISATDTSLASGMFGLGATEYDYGFYTAYLFHIMNSARLESPASPQPRVMAYLEVPVIGSGTPDDPFRAQMPEEIAWEWSLNPQAKRKYDILKRRGLTEEEILLEAPEIPSCRVNRLALTHSSLIKTDRATGKPVEYVAIVRVFEQPDRPAYLYSIDRALEALRSMPGVRVLSREEAIRRAKRIDPDLTDVDLLPIKHTDPGFKQVLRDYVAHRVSMGVREELIDGKLMERYLQEDKGW